MDPRACATYEENHKEVMLVKGDIKKIDPSMFSHLLKNRLDLLVICAPCQPFSSQNRKRNREDHRMSLVLDSLPFVIQFDPKIIFLENVPGLESNNYFSKFISTIQSIGYQVSKPVRVDASDFGVPQRRNRMILVATKGPSLLDSIEFCRSKLQTVREAIADLPLPPVGKENSDGDPLHFSRRHSDLNIQRLKHIPKNGGDRSSLPLSLSLSCHRSRAKNSFSDVYGRMGWDEVSPTLTTGCSDITKGRFAHPEQDRAITLREAARLQSFPDSYIFKGNVAEVARQIGNAVPPMMMKVIGDRLMQSLKTGNAE
jgi:DNA (cytosine-5)-methyltransferase 1